jgi:hypothetical protein
MGNQSPMRRTNRVDSRRSPVPVTGREPDPPHMYRPPYFAPHPWIGVISVWTSESEAGSEDPSILSKGSENIYYGNRKAGLVDMHGVLLSKGSERVKVSEEVAKTVAWGV